MTRLVFDGNHATDKFMTGNKRERYLIRSIVEGNIGPADAGIEDVNNGFEGSRFRDYSLLYRDRIGRFENSSLEIRHDVTFKKIEEYP